MNSIGEESFSFSRFLLVFAMSFLLIGVASAIDLMQAVSTTMVPTTYVFHSSSIVNYDLNYKNVSGGIINTGQANLNFKRLGLLGVLSTTVIPSSDLANNDFNSSVGTIVIDENQTKWILGTNSDYQVCAKMTNDTVAANDCNNVTLIITAVDLNVFGISVTSAAGTGQVELGTSFTVDVNVMNDNATPSADMNAGAGADLNLFFETVDVDYNTLISGELTIGTANSKTMTWIPTATGTDLNVYVFGTYAETDSWDSISIDDYIQTTIDVIAVDLNIINASDGDTLFPNANPGAILSIEYGLPLTVDVNFQNLGDYNGSDNDVNVRLQRSIEAVYTDVNSVIVALGDYNTDGTHDVNVDFNTLITPATFDFNIIIDYAGATGGYDNNLTDNSALSQIIKVATVDANAQSNSFANLAIPGNTTLEYGTTVPVVFTFTYVNSGDSNGSDDVNVIFNFNSVDVNAVVDPFGAYDTNETAITNTVQYNASALVVGSYDLNARTVYDYNNDSLASEFTTSNNYTTVATLDVNAVDLNVMDGGSFVNVTTATDGMNDYNVEFGVPLNVTWSFVNNGTYDGNGDVNAILRFNTSDVNSTTYSNYDFNLGVNKYTTGSNLLTFTPIETTTGSVDLNFRVDYLNNTADASDENVLNDSTLFTISVVAVDLNAETILINGSSVNNVAVEYLDPFTVDFNFTNRGNYDGNGTTWIMLNFNGDSDENTFSDSDFNVNSVQSATTVSITPNVIGANIDVNADVNYMANTTNADENNDGDTANVLSRDINVVYVDLNAETILINGSSVNNVAVEYNDPFTVDFNFTNRGNYNGNGTTWIMLNFNGGSDENTFSDTDFNVAVAQQATQVSITPNVIGANVDVNADVNYTTTTGATQYASAGTADVLSRDINVVYVDLNAETLKINGSSASSVAVEIDQPFTVDFNFTNRGNYNGNGTTWIILDFNSGADENTFSDSDFNVAVAQQVTTISITPNVTGVNMDMNADVNYTTTTDAIQYNNSNTANVLSKDVNVVSVDLNAESLSLDDSSVTTGTTVTATLTLSNVQDDINGAEDLNILFYVEGTLTDYNDDFTQSEFDNADGDLIVSFSYTPSTAGSYDFNVTLDYLGTESDETNNSENATLTVTAAPVTNSPRGGGGTSGTKKETEESTEYEFNASNGESPLYIDAVEVNYKVGEKESANLKVILPNMATTDKISDEDVTVIKYLQLTYSGDQSKIVNAIVTFTVGKDEASDPSLIKLARLKDGVWEYYTPSKFVDNGTFYTFEVEVPGFSYFAVVLKASAPGEITPVKEIAKETVEGTEPAATTEPVVTPDTTPVEETSTGLAWWIWVIIAIVVVVIVVVVIMDLRK